ncbi:ATPase domain-containing protein [Microvirga yunnanensis]|uniref:ATPase domain-containing protein n=1 Tax=Microvirga yunnanensis TaxID=2953740 RepID=UPI00359FED07
MGKTLARLESGIAGLDTILCGGLVDGSSYIVQGQPGAGKTILANQIAFHQARIGRRVLYVTLLAESHERLFQSLSSLDFYESKKVGNSISFISVFQTLMKEGLGAVVDVLRQEIRRQQASLLIFDGLLNARDRAGSALDVKTFVAELQAHAAFAHCTALFLTSARVEDVSPEHTMVDGVIELSADLTSARSVRQLQVRKSRGSAALGGYHQYVISGSGISVFPRVEAVLARPSRDDYPDLTRVASGVTSLDAIIGGGLRRSSVTLLMGPAGSGKTTFGMNFLSLATEADPALHFGFYETPARLALKGQALGIDFKGLVERGVLEMMWRPLTENLLDQLGHELLDAVRQRGVKRLFIDGLGGFHRAAVPPQRLVEYLTALTNELRALGVTTVATWELRDLFGAPLANLSPEFPSILDNLLLLRLTELQAKLRRILAVIKVRDSAFDPRLYPVDITAGGIMTGQRLEDAERTATGVAHSTGSRS